MPSKIAVGRSDRTHTYRLGRKIVYRGADLNAWADANRVDPAQGGRD